MLASSMCRLPVIAQLVFLLIPLTGCGPDGGSYAPPTHFSIDQLAGEWIGFPDEGDDEIYQLTLEADSTGVLRMAGRLGIDRYPIAKWELTTNISLACRFVIGTSAVAPEEMRCNVKKRSLRAVLWSKSGGWRRHIIFRRTQDLQWLKDDKAK